MCVSAWKKEQTYKTIRVKEDVRIWACREEHNMQLGWKEGRCCLNEKKGCQVSVEASFALFLFIQGCRRGWFMLVEKVLSGSRKCDWMAAFREARTGLQTARPFSDWWGRYRRSGCNWEVRPKNPVLCVIYKPLDSSQTLKLQTRQAISNFHQRGVRKRRSPWQTPHTGAKGET